MNGEVASARLAELARRHALNERQRGHLGALLAILATDRRAPTAVRSPERAVDVHVADSLAALELDVVRSAGVIADVGSGAGFPGLALAIALVAADVRLVESQGRKCLFLKDVLARLEVPNARIACTRAELWTGGAGQHDVVLARAVAAQPVVLEYAAPLLRLGGTLVDWRGGRVAAQEQAAQRAAAELGLSPVEVHETHPFEGANEHFLHLYLKVRDTPAGFPRRPGMARKRPLGAVGAGDRATRRCGPA